MLVVLLCFDRIDEESRALESLGLAWRAFTGTESTMRRNGVSRGLAIEWIIQTTESLLVANFTRVCYRARNITTDHLLGISEYPVTKAGDGVSAR
jgi:hypothetical protein